MVVKNRSSAIYWLIWLFVSTGVACWRSPSAMALSAVEVAKIAKSVTVSIDSLNSVGSGVVIKKEGSTYIVLTAAHVVRNRQQEFKITTPDGKNYPLSVTNIKAASDTDLAIVKFQSSSNYPIAKLGNVETATEGSIVYVSGFPAATTAINESIYNFTEGKVTANARRPLTGGYSLVYSNNTLPGMSGGPVFNEAGETIAIHGKGDIKESSEASDINTNVRVKTGFNLGIPTNTFMQLASSLGVYFGLKSQRFVAIRPPAALQAVDFFLIGVDRFNRGNLAGSIEAMDRSIELNPRYTKAYLARASANFMFKRAGLALADTNRAIQSDPNSAIAYAGKCFILSDLGNNGAALDVCNRSVAMAPKNAITYNIRGWVYTRLGNFNGATADLKRAIQLDPTLYYSYTNLALTYYVQKNLLGSIELARRAVQIAPQSPGAHSLLGQLLVANKDYQPGLVALNRALGLNPKIADAYKARAAAHQALGNISQAKLDTQLAQQFALSSPVGFIDDISFLNQ
jgi:S1-C subfamily serine protease